jgi:hypothetical protein
MPKFKIQASYITYLSVEIEAETMDEAKDIAYTLDGGDFKEDDGYGDFNIDDIRQLDEVTE